MQRRLIGRATPDQLSPVHQFIEYGYCDGGRKSYVCSIEYVLTVQYRRWGLTLQSLDDGEHLDLQRAPALKGHSVLPVAAVDDPKSVGTKQPGSLRGRQIAVGDKVLNCAVIGACGKYLGKRDLIILGVHRVQIIQSGQVFPSLSREDVYDSSSADRSASVLISDNKSIAISCCYGLLGQ